MEQRCAVSSAWADQRDLFGTMRKRLVLAVLVLIALLGAAAWWLYHSREHLVAQAIRNYGPGITGVPVKLQGVKLDPYSGLASLKGLELGNPPGFKTRRSMELGEISLRIDVATLADPVVRIKELRVVKPYVTYERGDGTSNLDVIERNVQRYIAEQTGSAGVTAASGKGTAASRKLIIEHLYIQGARADASTAMLQGRSLTVDIADIHLQSLGEKSGGATPAEVSAQVVGAVTHAVLKSVAMAPVNGVVNAIKGLFK